VMTTSDRLTQLQPISSPSALDRLPEDKILYS